MVFQSLNDKAMKKIGSYVLVASFLACVAVCMTSCGSFSNMSQEDAYDMGRGIGIGVRHLIDN